MKIIPTILMVLLVSSMALAEGKYSSEALGFEISTPEPGARPGGYLVCTFSLPPVDGFGANVNVQLQEFDGTLQDYLKLSEEQFQQLELHIVDSKLTADDLTIEYSGKMGTIQMHWFARALKKGERIYLVTGTSLDSLWKTQGPILVKSVRSFRFN